MTRPAAPSLPTARQMREAVEAAPVLGINTQELLDNCEMLIAKAKESKEDFGAVNWGDIGVRDIEYRLSMMSPSDGPECVVMIYEASPDCRLARWITEMLGMDRVRVEAEW